MWKLDKFSQSFPSKLDFVSKRETPKFPWSAKVELEIYMTMTHDCYLSHKCWETLFLSKRGRSSNLNKVFQQMEFYLFVETKENPRLIIIENYDSLCDVKNWKNKKISTSSRLPHYFCWFHFAVVFRINPIANVNLYSIMDRIFLFSSLSPLSLLPTSAGKCKHHQRNVYLINHSIKSNSNYGICCLVYIQCSCNIDRK